jgi:hypothetical protein
MTERDNEVLGFIGMHGEVLRLYLEIEFGQEVYHSLKRLMTRGYVHASALVGQLKRYRLSAKGASTLGVSEAKGRPYGPQAIHHRLTVGWLCSVRNYEIVPRDKAQQLLDAPPSVTYLVSHGKDSQTTVFQCLTPGPHTSVTSIVRSVKQKERARNKSKLSPGESGYIIAVDSPIRRSAIVKALKAAKLYGELPLRVELTPSVNNLQEMIRNARNTTETID